MWVNGLSYLIGKGWRLNADAEWVDERFVLNPLNLTSGVLQGLGILLKGTAVTLAGLTTLSTVDTAELQVALTRLFVSSKVSALITQVLIQAGILVEETGNLIRAVRVRVPTGRLALSWMLARSISTIWLPRVLDRGERVSSAMTLRGFDGEMRIGEHVPAGHGDWLCDFLAHRWGVRAPMG